MSRTTSTAGIKVMTTGASPNLPNLKMTGTTVAVGHKLGLVTTDPAHTANRQLTVKEEREEEDIKKACEVVVKACNI